MCVVFKHFLLYSGVIKKISNYESYLAGFFSHFTLERREKEEEEEENEGWMVDEWKEKEIEGKEEAEEKDEENMGKERKWMRHE